jgi:salicylate hydroxylase
MTDCHVIIIGAGIGGLTAALSLQHHGVRVSIYEHALELREFGAGLLVAPNAMNALNFLGVGATIAAVSNVSTGVVFKHYQTGEILRRLEQEGTSKYGAGLFQVHRADLHNALSAAVLANDAGCIHLGHSFTDLSQDSGGVAAQFANGVVASADALIGCDGHRSAVREKVHGSAPVAYMGQVSFRALLPVANLPPELRKGPRCMYLGPGRQFLHYLLRNGTVMNIVAHTRQPRWQDEGWQIRAEIQEFLDLYKDFHPDVPHMIQSIEPDSLFKWGLRDREPLAQWTIGRISALGDAAHPMSPFLGQGAAMAIEDGMVLGRCFAKAGTPEEALVLYECARKQRANGVQLASWEQAKLQQGSSLEDFTPGRPAHDRGLFDYNPVTVPI